MLEVGILVCLSFLFELDLVLPQQNSTYDVMLNESFGCLSDFVKNHIMMSANSYTIIKGSNWNFITLSL